MIQIPIDTQVYFQLALFVVSMIIGIGITRSILMPAVARIVNRRDGDVKAVHSFQNVAGVLGYFVAVTIALQVAGFGNLLTVIGTIAAAATVAIGFGMRDQISSLVAGVFIHTDNPYVKGDYIEVDDHEGIVREVRLRATVIESDSRPKQVVPNNLITTKTLKNYTRGRKTRRNIEVKAPLSKAEEVAEILRDKVSSHEDVWKKPKPKTDFRSIEDDKVLVTSSFWIGNPEEARRIQDELLRAYRSEIEEKGILTGEKEES